MKLNLKRPLVFIDIEATGLNVGSDRIVELALLKVYPNGNTESKVLRVNPTIPIPAEVSKIHGILDEHIKDCQTFKEIAPDIKSFIGGSDLAGYNSNKFD